MIFVNKMDRLDANFEACVDDVQKKLKTIAIPLQMPYRKENVFTGN
jgi:translation elongation factor EF-G